MRSSRRSEPPRDPRRALRCAIYTRKSSDEGLDQSFNSLDAQRAACAAFIASQKHEGWIALTELYDDGGFSGGSMERPSLKRLLADVARGSIDVVVVYKVDRLTRSLSDFARLTEIFEQNSSAFVSVTQQFNTSTSMGRLTLNVLLSFAQFERELASERIRDKIALSKRRGMWMGGLPPLGYDGVDKKLVVNATEAESVREIFRRYLEVGSVAELRRSLAADGIVSKQRSYSNGRTAGGVPFSRGAIYQILRNRLYRGEIAYRGEVHRAEHQAIVDEALWAEVQERLTDQSQRRRGSASSFSEPAGLSGLVYDGDGARLTPTYTTKRGRRYRYYVSATLVRGGFGAEGIRVPASDLESLVRSAMVDHLRNPDWLAGLLDRSQGPSVLAQVASGAADLAKALSDRGASDSVWKQFRPLISRVLVAKKNVTIVLDRAALARSIGIDDSVETAAPTDGPIEIIVDARTLRCGKQVRIVVGEVASKQVLVNRRLLRLVADAHRWFEDLRVGRAATIAEIAARDHQEVSHVSRLISLAFLAPDIVEMIVDGRQPATLTAEIITNRRRSLPLAWAEQRATLLG